MDRKEFFEGLKHVPGYDQHNVSRIQSLCRDGFEIATPNIIGIAKGENDLATPAVQVRAHNNLGRYGLGKNQVIVLENREWLAIVMKITSEFINDRDSMIEWMQAVFAALGRKLDPKDENA